MRVGKHQGTPGQRLRTPEQLRPAAVPAPSASGGTAVIRTDRVPEADIDFDTAGGHTHDGSDSRLIALAGDVTGVNNAAVVGKLLGMTIPAPVAGDDEKCLSYEHTGTTLEWKTLPTTSVDPQYVTQVAANYSQLATDYWIFVDTSAGDVTVTLLEGGTATHQCGVKKKTAANTLHVVVANSGTIDGAGGSSWTTLDEAQLFVPESGMNNWKRFS